MMRAASIPHLGQITPTAVLGLRAIRSLLTSLDADGLRTVRSRPTTTSAAPRFRPGLYEIESFLGRSTAVFLMKCGNVQDGVPTMALTFVDTTVAGPTFPSPCKKGRTRPFGATSYIVVSTMASIYVIVGILALQRTATPANMRNTA